MPMTTEETKIAIPRFAGYSVKGLTLGRWDSFGCKLTDPTDLYVEAILDWISYRTEADPKPVTLRQWMTENGLSIKGWYKL